MAGPASPVRGVSVPFCAPLPRHAWEGARQPENASEHLPTQASSSETLSLRLSFSDEQMLFFFVRRSAGETPEGAEAGMGTCSGRTWERLCSRFSHPSAFIYRLLLTPLGFTAEHHPIPQQSPKQEGAGPHWWSHFSHLQHSFISVVLTLLGFSAQHHQIPQQSPKRVGTDPHR